MVEDNPSGGAIFFVLLPRAAAESLAKPLRNSRSD